MGEAQEITENAVIFMEEVRNALANGVEHFRKSDNQKLLTAKDVLLALLEEGSVYIKEV